MKTESETIVSLIEDALANYWLCENRYCGLNCHGIRDRVQRRLDARVTLRSIRDALGTLEMNGSLSTRKVGRETWAYPKIALLKPRDALANDPHVGRYTKELRWGGSQYELRYFDRQVLDRYLNDPRFRVEECGPSGTLSMRDKTYLDPSTPERDKIGIQQYGFAYGPNGAPIVAVFLRYLGMLTPEHQSYWVSFKGDDHSHLDADFAARAFEGEWVDRLSPFDAFLLEMIEVNKLCSLVGYPSLFRATYDPGSIPNFSWLTKPTRQALDTFLHTLDKLLSDNLNKDFFKAQGQSARHDDGNLKGTITLLEEFLQRRIRTDSSTVKEVIETLRSIRSRREKPAHAISTDAYDFAVLEEQRMWMQRAVVCVNILRQMFSWHPQAKASYEAPKWLDGSRIA
jgi:hypothetical protein